MKMEKVTVRNGYTFFRGGRLITPEDGTFNLDLDSEDYKSQDWKIQLERLRPENVKKEEHVSDEKTTTAPVEEESGEGPGEVEEEETEESEEAEEEETEEKAVEKANNRAITRVRRNK